MKKAVYAAAVCLMLLAAVLPAAYAEELTADLDLSGMSGTVVYAQIYNLMVEPDPWLGKIIRLSGLYSCYDDPLAGIVYHACVVPDATACCANGIEFVRAGEYTWPDDYPEEGSTILVTGRLEIYEESGCLFLHLVDAEVSW